MPAILLGFLQLVAAAGPPIPLQFYDTGSPQGQLDFEVRDMGGKLVEGAHIRLRRTLSSYSNH